MSFTFKADLMKCSVVVFQRPYTGGTSYTYNNWSPPAQSNETSNGLVVQITHITAVMPKSKLEGKSRVLLFNSWNYKLNKQYHVKVLLKRFHLNANTIEIHLHNHKLEIYSKYYHVKVLLKRFHLNGDTIGFHPQTQKLELHTK